LCSLRAAHARSTCSIQGEKEQRRPAGIKTHAKTKEVINTTEKEERTHKEEKRKKEMKTKRTDLEEREYVSLRG
jgi:hypothetical protein